MRERPLFALAVSCVLGEVLAAFSLEMSFTAVALPALGLQLFFVAAFFLWEKRKKERSCEETKRQKKYETKGKGRPEGNERSGGKGKTGKEPGRRSSLVLPVCLFLGFWSGLLGYRTCSMEYMQDLSACDGETVILTGTVTYAEERESGVYYYLKEVTVYAGENGGSETAGIKMKTKEETAAFRKALVIDYTGGSTPAESGEENSAWSFWNLFAEGEAGEDAEDTETGSAYYVGKRVTLSVTYGAMRTAANPGNYDEKSYYESRGIGLKATLNEWKTAEGEMFSVTNLLYRIRLAFHSRFYGLTDEKTAAFCCGMLLGESYEISSEDKETFRTGGIGHILAISGLHISLIGMAVYRGLKLRLREGTATAAGIVFMVLYGMLTGGSPSALRAVAMFALRILAGKCGRKFDFLSAAGFSAYTILLFEPNYLFYSGFQLSFCAVFGAALAVPMVQNYLKVTGKLKTALLSGLVIQTVILPVQLYYFYQIAPYSILLNLIVIPSMGVVLGAGILGVLTGFVWSTGGSLLLAAGGKLLNFYEWLCKKTLAFPGGLLITGAPSAVRIALFYGILAAVLAFAARRTRQAEKNGGDEKRIHLINIRAMDFRIIFPWFRGKDRKREKIHEEKRLGPRLTFAAALRRLCFVTILMTAAVLILTGKNRPKLKTVFLDVGQGNGIFLESETGTTWLVDGGSSSITDVGTYRILPYLKWAGVSKIDYMVLTHVDSDHYSGLLEILEQAQTGVRVGCLLVPDMADLDENYAIVVQTAEENDVPVCRLMTGVTWKEKELKIDCIWPDADADFTDTNEGSGVLYVTCGKFSMLLTGDIGEETEKTLTDSGTVGDTISRITVLGVPHHGSKYSSTEAFLAALSPSLAVISVGENTYGHPAEETLARLTAAGAATCTTLACGALTLTTDGEKVEMQGYKNLQITEP